MQLLSMCQITVKLSSCFVITFPPSITPGGCILSLARFTDVCSSAMVTTLAAGPSLAIVVVVEEVFEGLDLLDDLRDEATLRLVRHDHELTG